MENGITWPWWSMQNIFRYTSMEQVAKSAIHKNKGGTVVPGMLRLGKTVWSDGYFMCDGAIDELRLSNIARKIHDTPTAAFTTDEHVVALWSFEPAEVTAEYIKPFAGTSWLSIDRNRPLSETDNASFRAAPSPLDWPSETISVQPGKIETPSMAQNFSLDGEWQLAEGGTDEQRLNEAWDKPIIATVPGS